MKQRKWWRNPDRLWFFGAMALCCAVAGVFEVSGEWWRDWKVIAIAVATIGYMLLWFHVSSGRAEREFVARRKALVEKYGEEEVSRRTLLGRFNDD